MHNVFHIEYSEDYLGCPFAGRDGEIDSTIRTEEVADPETTTPNGCTCASICGPSAEDAFTVLSYKYNRPNLSNF